MVGFWERLDGGGKISWIFEIFLSPAPLYRIWTKGVGGGGV